MVSNNFEYFKDKIFYKYIIYAVQNYYKNVYKNKLSYKYNHYSELTNLLNKLKEKECIKNYSIYLNDSFYKKYFYDDYKNIKNKFKNNYLDSYMALKFSIMFYIDNSNDNFIELEDIIEINEDSSAILNYFTQKNNNCYVYYKNNTYNVLMNVLKIINEDNNNSNIINII